MAGLQTDDIVFAGYAEAKKDEYEKKSPSSDDHHLSHTEFDSVHEGLEFPTDEERDILRRVSDSVPWNAYMIAFIELAERFSYYGATVVFTNFIQQPLPPGSKTGAAPNPTGQAGALGLGQRASTGIGTFNSFWVYVIPLFGAYLATLDGVSKPTSLPSLPSNTREQSSFATTKSGERVIVDPALTTTRIYMYFYLFINIGALVGQIGMSYSERYVGYYLAFTLPTVVFLLCPFVLYFGRNRYITSPPTGSVLSKSVRIWRLAMKGRWSWNPVKTFKALYAPDFWESAKPSNYKGETLPIWMTFDDQWVDEVKRGFKACAVFLWYPVYWLTYNQLNNNLTSQAATMSTHGVPNDVALQLGSIRADHLHPDLRHKITTGFFTGAAAMIWAAVVQHYIYKTNPCGYHAATCQDADGNPLVSPLNVWIQTGSYVLIAFSEIFASITGLEYAFTKAPKNMRSLVMSVFLFMSAISSAIGEAFVTLSADPLLVWNYGVMGVLAGISGILFWFQFRHLDAQEDELNALVEGSMGEKD
ncbi:putative peptide transporter ptr2 [Grifola frondosa]|uniref:Putative peptide transporter ptr2 n=1 Tax=Grifola frondosa TaxID=5627 RepID=A0A1C7LP69_GRIFR|nr:putative peptide transporter ptr2 [Grifola frondosa]